MFSLDTETIFWVLDIAKIKCHIFDYLLHLFQKYLPTTDCWLRHWVGMMEDVGGNGSSFVSKIYAARIWQFLLLIKAELHFLRSWENVRAFQGWFCWILLYSVNLIFILYTIKRETDNTQTVKMHIKFAQAVAIINCSIDKR